jgi:type II secretory pathway component PulF
VLLFAIPHKALSLLLFFLVMMLRSGIDHIIIIIPILKPILAYLMVINLAIINVTIFSSGIYLLQYLHATSSTLYFIYASLRSLELDDFNVGCIWAFFIF